MADPLSPLLQTAAHELCSCDALRLHELPMVEHLKAWFWGSFVAVKQQPIGDKLFQRSLAGPCGSAAHRGTAGVDGLHQGLEATARVGSQALLTQEKSAIVRPNSPMI